MHELLHLIECHAQQKLSADNDLLGVSVLRPSTDTLMDLTATPSNSREYCLVEQESPSVGNYINMTFVHTMLVEKVVSRGLDFPDDGVSYVSNFSILYWSEFGGETKMYNEVSVRSVLKFCIISAAVASFKFCCLFFIVPYNIKSYVRNLHYGP